MQKRVLFSVLDWGLGHASRSIPVINALIARGCEVILAGDGNALVLLRQEFPELTSYNLPAYNVLYNSRYLFLNVLRNSPKIHRAIRQEHKAIKIIAQKERVDVLLTDNRYGCHLDDLPSVIITHQIQFRTGYTLVDRLANKKVSKWLAPFDYIWIPDNESHDLSGDLSRTTDPRKRCIGWLSTVEPKANEPVYDIIAILSGPEPQRTQFEQLVIAQLQTLDLRTLVVRGVPGVSISRMVGSVEVFDMVSRNKISELIAKARVVLCRSGYSSLMDLQSAGQPAIIIPTPGQPEQEYLAARLHSTNQYTVQQQDQLDIAAALEYFENATAPEVPQTQNTLLQNAISQLLDD